MNGLDNSHFHFAPYRLWWVGLGTYCTTLSYLPDSGGTLSKDINDVDPQDHTNERWGLPFRALHKQVSFPLRLVGRRFSDGYETDPVTHINTQAYTAALIID